MEPTAPISPTGEVDNGQSFAGTLARVALTGAGWVAVGILIGAAVRFAESPDAGRTAVMRVAKAGENYAMFAARVWAGIADVCNASYERARPVNA